MKKALILSAVFFLLMPFLSGCDKEKPSIFLSSRPITVQTFYPEKVFELGEPINFAVLSPEEFTSSRARVQVVKLNEKVSMYGYKLSHARDIGIDTSKKFFIDSLTLHEKGHYVIRIFCNENLKIPLVETFFKVVE